MAENRPQVAFVGLGAIGLPMATSIARAGLTVTGIEPFDAARERAAEAGIRAVPSLADAPGASVTVVMVATGDQLNQVVDQALAAGVVDDATWIISSTVGPDAVRAASDRLTAVGGRVVDAPVSGGIPRAKKGDLLLFVSGAHADIALAQPVLDAMGRARVVGDRVGDGQSFKVVNQHLCAVHIAAAAEALALAERLGLDGEYVLDVPSEGAAQSFMMGDRGPRMLDTENAPVLSQISIFTKDTGLVADAGEAVALEMPILEAARSRYLQAAEMGLERADDSSVIETYRAGERR